MIILIIDSSISFCVEQIIHWTKCLSHYNDTLFAIMNVFQSLLNNKSINIEKTCNECLCEKVTNRTFFLKNFNTTCLWHLHMMMNFIMNHNFWSSFSQSINPVYNYKNFTNNSIFFLYKKDITVPQLITEPKRVDDE